MWLDYVSERNRVVRGDAVAVVDDSGSITFAELDSRSRRLAAGLVALGVAPGDRVAVTSRNRREFVETYIALTRAGAVACPINQGLVAQEVSELLERVDARGVIGEREGIDVAAEHWEPGFAVDFDSPQYADLTATETPAALPAVGPDDVALMLFTSATTGLAKGAMITHSAIRATSLNWLATMRLPERAVYLSCTPLFHSTSTIAMAFLAGGATLVLQRQFSPPETIELIERERVTHAYLVPSMVQLCARNRKRASADLSSLQEIFHGAAPMSLEQRRFASDALDCRLRDCYGQAEAGGAITLFDPVRDFDVDESAAPWLRSVGRPLLGFEAQARDEEGQPLPPDERGEIWVRGAALMRGYWQQPDATERALVGGWLRTGDIGKVDAQGYVHLLDRRSDLILRGGLNVYPAEVERVLVEHPAVDEVAVVGRKDRDWGEVPVAFVVPREGESVEPRAILRFATGQLAPYKRPVEARLVDELPRSEAGKVLRRRLREVAEAARA